MPVHAPFSTKKPGPQAVHEVALLSVHVRQLESVHAEMEISTTFSKIVLWEAAQLSQKPRIIQSNYWYWWRWKSRIWTNLNWNIPVHASYEKNTWLRRLNSACEVAIPRSLWLGGLIHSAREVAKHHYIFSIKGLLKWFCFVFTKEIYRYS